MLRILTWNLMHGGGPTRTAEAAILLAQARPDIVILTEFRAARGSQLLSVLADAGLGHAASAPPARGGNTVTIAARWPLQNAAVPIPAPDGRSLSCEIPAVGLAVLGVHVPDESSVSPRDRAWSATLAWARGHAGRPAVIAGDFNTSRTGIDPDRENQTCEHCLGVLESLGFRDAWRAAHPGSTAVSWFGPCGERQRLDAAFVSRPLAESIESAVYDAGCVELGLSDHAVLAVQLRLELPETWHVGWMAAGAEHEKRPKNGGKLVL